MRWIALLVLLPFLVPGRVCAEDWSVNGKVYKNVKVVEQDDDGVRISYQGGLGKLAYSDLPLDIQKRFGQDFDSLQEKKKAADLEEAKIDAQLAEQQKKQDAASTPASQQTRSIAPTVSGQTAQPSAPASPHPIAAVAKPAGPPPQPEPYPGAKFTYNDKLDNSYLDSEPIDLISATGAPVRVGIGSVILRTVTEGPRPEAPTRIEAVFLSSTSGQSIYADHDVTLISNGTRDTLHASKKEDASIVPGAGVGYMSYDLTPEEARTISSDRNVAFTTNGVTYKLRPAAVQKAQTYFFHVAALPPASSELVRLVHHFINSLPPFVVLISQTCQYIILSAAGILVCTFFIGMTLGALRFFNT